MAGALDSAFVWPAGRYVSLGALLASLCAAGLSSPAGCGSGLGFPHWVRTKGQAWELRYHASGIKKHPSPVSALLTAVSN